jgi:hypothetical protein
MDAGYKKFMSFCKAKTQSPKTARMPFLGSARDSSGNPGANRKSGL